MTNDELAAQVVSLSVAVSTLMMRLDAAESAISALSLDVSTLSATKVDAPQVEAIIAANYSAMDADVRARIDEVEARVDHVEALGRDTLARTAEVTTDPDGRVAIHAVNAAELGERIADIVLGRPTK